jgi:hypothetical protein
MNVHIIEILKGKISIMGKSLNFSQPLVLIFYIFIHP